jgi:putative endonuclease
MKQAKKAQYFVYITASINGVLYIGFTDSLVKRIRQHKNGFYDNAFTKKYKVNRLMYWEKHDTKESALKREKELKGWKRDKKMTLIQSINPVLRDVYQDVIELYKASSW